jgi:exodeoxyribonuclease VII large subunit
LESRITSLRQLNPETIFARGYTRSEINGVPISQTKAEIGDQLMTHTLGDKITSTITQIEEK